MDRSDGLPSDQLSILLEELRQSRKYRGVSVEVALRALNWAAARQNRPDRILKTAKRKLHQIYGAFCGSDGYNKIDKLLDRLTDEINDAAVKTACRSILRISPSTRERMDYLDKIYSTIFSAMGMPRTILDIACGLTPFSRPWMPISPDVHYAGLDIEAGQIRLINRFFAQRGYAGRGMEADILTGQIEPVDLAFLFKALPSLEQQEKGAGSRLLADLPADVIVVSFPAQSLGGRDKGMRGNYDRYMDQLTSGFAGGITRWEFPTETFYLIKRKC
ncbi:MAG: hypothetical protein V2A61_08255 [Calditrichota bacterium]